MLSFTDIAAYASALWGTAMSACDYYWPSPCSIRLHPDMTDTSSMWDKLWASEAELNAQHLAVDMIATEIYPWAREFEMGRIPPAKALLIVGPVKTGKSFLAGKFADMLFDHCTVALDPRESTSVEDTETCSPIMDPSHGAILEIDVKKREYLDENAKADSINRMNKMIVEHQIRRKGLGSVIIMKHVDRLPIDELFYLSEVISGVSRTYSYYSQDAGKVSVNTDGTLFLFTSKTWGARSIQEEFLEERATPTGRDRVSFIESIEKEINRSTNSNFGRSVATIAPIFPFKESDLNIYLRYKIGVITAEHKGTRWKDVRVSPETSQFFAGPQYVDYDHYRVGNGNEVISYAICGAWSLDKGTLMNVSSAESLHARNPNRILVVEYERKKKSLHLCWLDVKTKDCEVEWFKRNLLNATCPFDESTYS